MAGPEIAHGGSSKAITEYLQHRGLNHILVVGSARRCRETELFKDLKNALPTLKIDFFHDFSPNPTFEEVWRGCQFLRQTAAKAILSLGGGSAIDIAKSVAGLNRLTEIDAKKAVMNGGKGLVASEFPHIAVPTTAGSGSEATHFAVVYLEGVKYSLASHHLLPSISIVDGVLSRSMPKTLAASTAMDALCQAIESYWAVAATDESITYAAQALRLLHDHIQPAVCDRDFASHNKLAEAATLAGQAINITKTTAAHAYSYYLTSRHAIPHGHAVSLCLPAIARCNFLAEKPLLPVTEITSRFQGLFRITGTTNLEEFLRWFQNIMTAIGLEYDARALGFQPETELRSFLNAVNIARLQNNPVEIDNRQFADFFLHA